MDSITNSKEESKKESNQEGQEEKIGLQTVQIGLKAVSE
jgi:hypothetical protein